MFSGGDEDVAIGDEEDSLCVEFFSTYNEIFWVFFLCVLTTLTRRAYEFFDISHLLWSWARMSFDVVYVVWRCYDNILIYYYIRAIPCYLWWWRKKKKLHSLFSQIQINTHLITNRLRDCQIQFLALGTNTGRQCWDQSFFLFHFVAHSCTQLSNKRDFHAKCNKRPRRILTRVRFNDGGISGGDCASLCTWTFEQNVTFTK